MPNLQSANRNSARLFRVIRVRGGSSSHCMMAWVVVGRHVVTHHGVKV